MSTPPDFDKRAELVAEVLWETVSDITHGNYDAGTFRARGDGWIAVIAAALVAAYQQGQENLQDLLNEPHYQGSPLLPCGVYDSSTVMVSADWYARLKAFVVPAGTEQERSE